jgi:hypothetical protein
MGASRKEVSWSGGSKEARAELHKNSKRSVKGGEGKKKETIRIRRVRAAYNPGAGRLLVASKRASQTRVRDIRLTAIGSRMDHV